jgi:16S rRNA (cytidine1402-2'-O)-methyltransferase
MIVNSKTSNKDLKKGLYLVPTPIGNLKDITFRALETLRNSDFILCEDTRVSKNLLNKYKINTKLVSNHKFNEKKNLSKIIDILKRGLIVSMISDAGTPNISDPGNLLVNECLKNDIEIIPLPGPSAVTTALMASGFSDKFFFYGFFPEKNNEILKILETAKKLENSIIFFISAKKINKIIPYLKKEFSGRKILICREMSKLYEEFIRLDIDELKLFEKKLKGELTIVISEKLNKKNSLELSESDKRTIKQMINKLSIKEITNLIYQNNPVSKKIIYKYCVDIKNEN